MAPETAGCVDGGGWVILANYDDDRYLALEWFIGEPEPTLGTHAAWLRAARELLCRAEQVGDLPDKDNSIAICTDDVEERRVWMLGKNLDICKPIGCGRMH